MENFDRSIAPAIQPISIPTIPLPEHTALAGGAQCYAIRQGTEAIVGLDVYLPNSFGTNGQNLAQGSDVIFPLNSLVGRMLPEGTATRSAQQVQEQIAQLGGFLEVGSSIYHTSLSLFCLPQHLPALLPVLADVLEAPKFAEAEWKIQQQQMLQSLEVNRQKTAWLAGTAFNKAIYGEHPFGHSLLEADIEDLNTATLAAHYSDKMQPVAPTIFMTGQFADSQLALVQSHFAGKYAQAEVLAEPSYGQSDEGLLEIEKADSTQITIRAGLRTIGRQHKDYWALRILTEIFGGFFGSRLMKNIREEKGLTYGISARLSPFKDVGHLVIGTDVNKENYQLAIAEIRHEMSRLQQDLVTDDEMALVRNHMLGDFASTLGTPFGTAEKWKNIVLNGLPDTFYADYLDAIRSVTPEQLRAAAQAHYRPNGLVVVAAGV